MKLKRLNIYRSCITGKLMLNVVYDDKEYEFLAYVLPYCDGECVIFDAAKPISECIEYVKWHCAQVLLDEMKGLQARMQELHNFHVSEDEVEQYKEQGLW